MPCRFIYVNDLFKSRLWQPLGVISDTRLVRGESFASLSVFSPKSVVKFLFLRGFRASAVSSGHVFLQHHSLQVLNCNLTLRMPSDYDATEFVDGDFDPHRLSHASSPLPRAPTREEVDSKVAAAHQRLAELKREKDEIERERAALEETRRRQIEFQTGRTEIIQSLTRGLGLLEEAEFSARRDAEQMSKTVAELKDALGKVEAVHEETWSKENFNIELTRGLTILENARMEWNSARMKFTRLSESPQDNKDNSKQMNSAERQPLADHSFGQLCRMGLALTWPLAAVAAFLGAALIVVLLRR